MILIVEMHTFSLCELLTHEENNFAYNLVQWSGSRV